MVLEDTAGAEIGSYLDSSALAKPYLPEPESDGLDALLRNRRDLLISEHATTEVLSAVVLKRREGMLNESQVLDGSATYVATFDVRMHAGALHAGLRAIEV